MFGVTSRCDTHFKAKLASTEFLLAFQPRRPTPGVYEYANQAIIQAATTRFECAIVEGLTMGGLQKARWLAQSSKEFAAATDNAGPSATVHSLLLPELKLKT